MIQNMSKNDYYLDNNIDILKINNYYLIFYNK